MLKHTFEQISKMDESCYVFDFNPDGSHLSDEEATEYLDYYFECEEMFGVEASLKDWGDCRWLATWPNNIDDWQNQRYRFYFRSQADALKFKLIITKK